MLMRLKQIFLMLAMCFCMTFAFVPMIEAQASELQIEEEAEEYEALEGAEETEEDEEEQFFFLIILGGGLLIVIFAVVVAISTFSSSIAVAANMDVDGE